MKRKGSFRENKKVKIIKRGNWCGGGWTAGQAKDASEMTAQDYHVPALSAQDQNCKNHDIALYEASTTEDVQRAHEQFYTDSADTWEGRAQSALVKMFGPTDPNPNKRKHKPIRRDHLQKSKRLRRSMGWWEDNQARNAELERQKKESEKTIPVPGVPGNPNSKPVPAPAPSGPNVVPPDDPMGQSPAVNLMATGVGGPKNKTHETPTDSVYDVIMKPFRRTQNVILPYRSLASTEVTFAANSKHTTFRLNSIYDIVYGTTFVANPIPGIGAPDGTPNQKPMLYEYWKKFYQYYSVTKVDYKIKIWTNTKKNQILSVWTYHHGKQCPPLVNAGAKAVPDYMRRIHPQCHQNELHAHGEATIPDYNMLSKYLTITGSHRPGQIDHEVAEDEYMETWTKFDAVPSQDELVTFIFQENDRVKMEEGQTFHVSWEMEMFFHVQLKDLVSDHQYPTEAVDLPAVTDMYKITE